ncbi:hypothetical protein N0V85_003609 [Neurospora sp. IMI 360204]|nr:hypothetical protein N0V85_003609 [Neurospora sp. IMI 360204]
MSSKFTKIGLRLVLDAAPGLALYDHAQLDKPNFVIPSLIPKRRQLDPNRRGKDAFSTIGKDAKTIAQKINNDPMGETLKEALQDWWGDMFKDIDETPSELRNELIFHYTSAGPFDGHRGYFAGSVPVKNAGELFKTEAILRHMLKSFPQGALIVDPIWMAKVKQAENKAEFIMVNAAEIKAAADKYLAEGGSLTKCGALLGSTNIVEVKGVIVQEIQGRIVQTMVVATTNQHALDGVNLWEAVYDPAHPDSVMFSNKLLGKHKLAFVMDYMNNRLGQGLMTTTWATVQFSIEAEAAGVPLEKYIADRAAAGDERADNNHFWRWVYAGLDGFAVVPAWFREHLDPHLQIDKGLSIILNPLEDRPLVDQIRKAKEDTPASAFETMHLKIEDKAAGFFVDRSPADPAVFMNFGATSAGASEVPPNLTSAALDAARNPVQQLMDAAMLSKVHASVSSQINKPTIETLLKKDPAGSARLMNYMRLNTPWTSWVESFLLQEVTQDVETEVFERLKQDAEWNGKPDALLHKAVMEAVRESVCSPLLARDGYVETCTYLDMPDAFKTVAPTAEELKDRLKKIEKEKGQNEKEVKNMEDQMAHLAKDSAEYKKAEKDVYEKKQVVEELQSKKEGTAELSKEAEHGVEGLKDKETGLKEMESDPKKKIFEHGK